MRSRPEIGDEAADQQMGKRGTHLLKTESQSQSHGGPCSHPEMPGIVPA